MFSQYRRGRDKRREKVWLTSQTRQMSFSERELLLFPLTFYLFFQKKIRNFYFKFYSCVLCYQKNRHLRICYVRCSILSLFSIFYCFSDTSRTCWQCLWELLWCLEIINVEFLSFLDEFSPVSMFRRSLFMVPFAIFSHFTLEKQIEQISSEILFK